MRTQEDEATVCIGSSHSLDRILKDNSSQPIAQLLNLINYRYIDLCLFADGVHKEVQPLLGEYQQSRCLPVCEFSNWQ